MARQRCHLRWPVALSTLKMKSIGAMTSLQVFPRPFKHLLRTNSVVQSPSMQLTTVRPPRPSGKARNALSLHPVTNSLGSSGLGRKKTASLLGKEQTVSLLGRKKIASLLGTERTAILLGVMRTINLLRSGANSDHPGGRTATQLSSRNLQRAGIVITANVLLRRQRRGSLSLTTTEVLIGSI